MPVQKKDQESINMPEEEASISAVYQKCLQQEEEPVARKEGNYARMGTGVFGMSLENYHPCYACMMVCVRNVALVALIGFLAWLKL